MINYEKHKADIEKIRKTGSDFGFADGKVQACRESICVKCEFKGACDNNRREWLWDEEITLETALKQLEEACKGVIRLLKAGVDMRGEPSNLPRKIKAEFGPFDLDNR